MILTALNYNQKLEHPQYVIRIYQTNSNGILWNILSEIHEVKAGIAIQRFFAKIAEVNQYNL
jgi:hypothetical protein